LSQPIYFISGLGADQRIFENLQLENASMHHIQWLQPSSNELLAVYAQRMAEQIKHANPILVGVSFGGIMAREISKLIPVQQIILISSVKTDGDIPRIYKWAGKLKLINIVKLEFLRKGTGMLHWFFGVREPNEKKLVADFEKNTTTNYLLWSLHQVTHWQNEEPHPQTVLIHGRKDRIFPIQKSKTDFVIENCGHFMVWNRAAEVSKIINSIVHPNHLA
jgi:pimeloyl-ACP methyl ester carboxylesterase